MHENEGSALPEGKLNSKITTCCAQKLIRSVVYKIFLSKKQDHLENHKTMRKATGKIAATLWNHRIPGISLSTVKQLDAKRQNKVKKLIEMFERHQHKEEFLQDLSQTQKINRFSEESQQLLADMNHTEIFELCEKFW